MIKSIPAAAHQRPESEIDLNQNFDRRGFLRSLMTTAAIVAFPTDANGHGAEMVPQMERVDYIESNFCYNRDTGEARFRQLIFWDRQNGAVPHVRAFIIVDENNLVHLSRANQDLYSPYPYLCVIKRDGAMIRVRSQRYKVTHTYNDPEQDDREVFPMEARRALKGW